MVDSPILFPLGAPTIDANDVITVDMALQQPEYITQRLSDLTLQRFIVDQIFSNNGNPVRGGAVIFDQITQNDLYTTNDVQQVAPGAEYPIVGADRMVPLVATVAKYGGKFAFTDEAKRRNDASLFDQKTQKLANVLVRKINTVAVAQIEAQIASMSGATTVQAASGGGISGTGAPTGGWQSIITDGSSRSSAQFWPASDFARVQLVADQTELGVQYNLWIVNPAELATLRTIYGQFLESVLASFGITMFPSNRVAAGTAYAVARGQVGFLKYERGLDTEVYRLPKNEATWVQSSVMPVMGVTNPYSIIKVTDLEGSP